MEPVICAITGPNIDITTAMLALIGSGALTSVFAQEVNMTGNETAVEANITNATVGRNMTGNVSANVTPSS
jgi:tRNA A58 N-methylase Trm61